MLAFLRPSLRFSRYGAVSLVSALLAQAGLSLGYGVEHWSVVEAVFLSLGMSGPVSYALNRTLVWNRVDRPVVNPYREVSDFLFVTLAGSGIGIGLIYGIEHGARLLTSGHLALTVIVDAAGLIAMMIIWMVRYCLLDRIVFRPFSSPDSPSRQDGSDAT